MHEGDLEGVLDGHADGIVMLDVPPPHDGVRGIEAYREVWPAFFDRQRSGACFELVSMEITAGDGVAFAQCLMRCGTPRRSWSSIRSTGSGSPSAFGRNTVTT